MIYIFEQANLNTQLCEKLIFWDEISNMSWFRPIILDLYHSCHQETVTGVVRIGSNYKETAFVLTKIIIDNAITS